MEVQPSRGQGAVKRDAFADQMSVLLAEWGAGSENDLRPLLDGVLADYSDEQLGVLAERGANTGGDWGYHPPDPIGRRLSREMMRIVLRDSSGVDDVGELEAARSMSAVLLGNHLSFIDVNVLDYLVSQAGYGDVAERVTALVGPKVFAEPIRRLASLCFGTIKLAQSAARASGEAVMRPREVARLARATIGAANERAACGDHLLIFPEGSRSRSGSLERCLAGVTRYLEERDAVVIPWGHVGSDQLMPLEGDHVRPAEVRMRIGPAIPARRLIEACSGKRQLVMDVVGFLIAALVPESKRGAYAQASGELREASEIAETLLA